MKGRRVHIDKEFVLEPGDYGIRNGIWYCKTPNGFIGNLNQHNVVEHKDGTITVTPSILVSDDQKELWHGYLTKGVWRVLLK